LLSLVLLITFAGLHELRSPPVKTEAIPQHRLITCPVSEELPEPRVPTVEKEISEAGEPFAENVYVILIDGLRVDALEVMPYVSSLAEESSYGVIQVEQPTYSRPAYARLITGASSSVNGINSNAQARRMTIPTLFDLAYDADLSTGISAYYWFYDIAVEKFNSQGKVIEDENLPIQYGYYYYDLYDDYYDEKTFEEGKRIVEEHEPNLMILHSMEVDILGHAYGGLSEQYRDAAYRNDQYIEEFINSIPNPEESVIMITSDHGMTHTGRLLPAGGHGGPEREAVEAPLIIKGKGVSGEELTGYTQVDFAPTIAGLLGLPFTAYMEGNIMTDAFQWDESTVQEKDARLQEVHQPFVSAMHEYHDVSYSPEAASLSNLGHNVQENAVNMRMIVAFIIAVILAIGAALYVSWKEISPYEWLQQRAYLIIGAVLATLGYAVVHQLIFYGVFDFSYSYSVMGLDFEITVKLARLLLALTLPALLAFVTFYLIYYYWMRKNPNLGTYIFSVSILILALFLVIVAAIILQGGSELFLPQPNYYMVLLFTLYHLFVTVIAALIGGKLLNKKVLHNTRSF